MTSSIDVVDNCLQNKPMAVMNSVGEVLRAKVAELIARERENILRGEQETA